MADVLDQLSSVIGRPVKPLERIQKPAKEEAPPKEPTGSGSSREQDAPNKPQDLENVIGRKLQPVKMQPLASARWQMYSTARKNGFDPEVAAKTAMSEAAVMTADPSNWKKITSKLGKIPTGPGSSQTFGDVASTVSAAWDRANNPAAMKDEDWEKLKTRQQSLIENAIGKNFLGGAATGAAEFAEEMTSPVQVALMVGTLGESALVEAAGKLGIEGAPAAARTLSKLIQVNFAAQMVEGTATGAEQAYKAAKSGDWENAGKASVEGLVSAVMAKGLATHELATEKVRGDLEKTAREMHGAPIGNPVTAAITSRFDQLDPYTQGQVIHETVQRSPQYQAVLAQTEAQNEKEARKNLRRYTDYHDRAINQAWDPDVARKAARDVDDHIRQREVQKVQDGLEANRQHYLKQIVSTLKTGVERQTAEVEEERRKQEEAHRENREYRPERKAQEREQKAVILTNAKQVAAARASAADIRAEADRKQTEKEATPSRPVDAQVSDDKHTSYRANYFGEENSFGVAGDSDALGVYRDTPRGTEYLDKSGVYTEKPQDIYLAPDQHSAEVVAQVSSLRHAAESEGNAKEEALLAGMQRDLISGDKTADQVQKEAGLAKQIELPTEVDALRAGDLKGPLADKSAGEFYSDLAKEAGETLSSGEKEMLLQQAGVVVRASAENNLHHIARSGDYVTSKKGVRWTLDSQGMLHPDDGGAPVPLLKNGHYSAQAIRLGISGRVGYGGRTREQRRADTAKQRSIQAMIDLVKPEISAAIDHVLKVAQQNQGLESTPENLPSEVEPAKRERAKGFAPPDPQTAQARQVASGIAALIRDGMEQSGAAEVVDSIAKENGVDAEEVLRQKLAQDDTPRGKAASLQVGDKITDPFRKAPWVVEESKSGGLQLRSGNANPLPLDRMNPTPRVLGLISTGGLEQERPITDQDLTHVAFESPHAIHRNELVEQVRAIQSGEPVPEPTTIAQAEAQAEVAERRTDAAVSVATETQADALEPPPGTTIEEAERKVDEADQNIKTAEAAYSQEAEAKSKTVPADPFPPRAPISIGLRGNPGVLKQNGRELPIHYEMVPLEALVTSHTWQGNMQVENGEFPSELQPRTISDQEALQNVWRARPQATDDKGMTTGYDFSEYADKTINGAMGPAVVEPGGRVVGGNTRIGIMRKHLELLNEISDPIEREVSLALFREQMRHLARENGIEPPLDEMNHVVVRVLDQPIETLRDAADLGRLLNKSISVQMTQSAKGVSYSKALTDENLSTLGRLIEDHDGLPGAMAANSEYFSNLVTNNFGIVPSEYADWFDNDTAKGLVLNEQGKRQFTKALLGTVFKDTSVLNRVEGTVPYRAIERALSYIIKMRSIPDRDLSAKVIDAVTASAETMDVDSSKSNTNDKWGATYRPDQQEFLGMQTENPPEPDRMVETLWRAMHGSNVAAPRTFNDRLKNWIGEESASNESLFTVHETPAELFSRVFAKELREVAWSRGDGKPGIGQAEYDSLLRNLELSKEAREEAERAAEGKSPKNKKYSEKTEKVAKTGAFTPPPTLETKPVTPEAKIAEAKAEKGFVTPDELKTFLGAQESTKEHVPEIMRTAQMMAEYVFDADPPEGVDRKEALGWILKERVSKLEVGGKGRGSYSDPLIEKGIGTGILKLTKAADETTFIHEFAHVIFPMLSEQDLRDLNTIHDTKIPQWDHDKTLKGDAYKGLSEKFAHGLEKFLRDENPTGFTAEVKKVLAKVKEIFKQAYLRFAGDPLNSFELSEEAKGVFSNMFGITDFDPASSWRDEVKKARAEAKRMTRPEDEPHPVVKIAKDLGATGVRKSFSGKVEETVGDRVDPKKPTVVLFFPSEETAKTAWLEAGTPGSKLQDAELIAGEDGTYGIRINTPSKVPTDVLFQEVPRKHPGIELEETKKRLAAIPESAPMVRKLLQLKIQNLENEIRAKYGAEERKPAEVKEAAKAAVQEKKNVSTGKQAIPGLRGLPERPAGDLGRRSFREIPQSALLGRQDDAAVRGPGGPLPGTRTLTGVKPVNLEPIAGRGEPVGITEGDKYNAKEWLDGLEKAGLPRNAPPPTVPISRETAAQLKYAGQKQVVQMAMSALEQGDGFVIASATGSGKTYTSMGVVKEFLNANPGAKVLVLTKNVSLLKNSARVGKESFGFETDMAVPVEQSRNVQPMRKGSTSGTETVPGMSRGGYAGISQGQSADGRTAQEDELSQLRPRVPQAGQAQEGAVPGVRGGGADASSELRQASGDRMAVPGSPSGTSSGNVARGTIGKGVYGTTYQRLLRNDVYKKADWDLVIADESGEMRNWYQEENKQGKAAIDVIDKSKKAVYVSATPFHSPAEYGYVKKLNLWPKNGFDKWISENFAHEKLGDKIVAKLDPGKQAKLRQQLIERGQFVSQMISYEGFTTHFGVVPIGDETRTSLNRIHEGVARAKAQLVSAGKKGLADRLSAFEATYTKAFLERSRLPQAIELTKKGLAAGWHPLIFSETTSEDLFRRPEDGEPGTYRKLDQEMGGELSRIIPPFSNVYADLKAELGDRIADFSGMDNTDAAREAAKQAYLDGRVPALYTTYAAGGIGVSLHDEAGDKPRLAIFLGPPYSGVLLEQAMGRPWRFGVKSNVHAIFLATDSEPDIQLMATKVGPRMRAVRASVLGERDSLGTVMGSYSDEQKTREQQDMLAYDQGNEVKVDAQSFQRRDSRNVKIDNWSAITIPHADTAKNKGMQIKTAGKDGDWATMYQPKNRFTRPPMSIGEMAAQRKLNQVADAIAKGTGLTPGDPMESMDPSEREAVAGAAAATGAQQIDIPVERDKGNASKMAAEAMYRPGWRLDDDGVWRKIDGFAERGPNEVEPPEEDERTDWGLLKAWTMSSETAIRSIAGQAGNLEGGRELVRMQRDYVQMVEKHYADYANEFGRIASDNKVDFHDDKVFQQVWDVVEGKTVSKDDAINKAAEEMADLMEIVHGDLSSADVKLKTPKGDTLSYRQMKSDRHHMPHNIDWDAKIEDPLTKEVATLKEVMGRTFSQAKRERMLQEIASKMGVTPAEAADYLNRMKTTPPIFGNIQRARTIDFPIYKKTLQTMMRYYEQAAGAIAREKVFGDNLSKLNAAIGKIPSENGRRTIDDMFQQNFRKQDWNNTYGKIYNKIAAVEIFTKMNWSAIKVPFHLANVPLALGGRGMPLTKAIVNSIVNRKEFKENTAMAGTIIRQVNPLLLMGDGTSGAAHWMLKKEGFEAAYRWGRAIAGSTARVYMEQYAMDALKKGGESAEEARRILKDRMLIPDKDIDAAIQKGSFSREALQTGQRAFANFTMFSERNPLQMPLYARLDISPSTSSGIANLNRAIRMTYLLQSFAVKFHSLLKETVYDEVKHGNYRPLAYMLIASPILGQMLKGAAAAVPSGVHRGIEQGTALVTGQPEKHSKDSWDRYLDQFKALYGDHPAIAALKIYVDGMCAQTALEMLRLVADPIMDAAAGSKKKAGAEFEYLKGDIEQSSIGPGWSSMTLNMIDLLTGEFKAAFLSKDDHTWPNEKKAFVRWLEGEVPSIKLIPGMETPSKKPASSGRLTAPPF